MSCFSKKPIFSRKSFRVSPSPTAMAREVVSVSVWYLPFSSLEMYAKESPDRSANLESEMPDFIRRRFTDVARFFVSIMLSQLNLPLS